MILAALLTTLGFFGVAFVTQRRGLRLGGTIVVPTLVVYGLREFATLPIFLASTAVGYVLLRAAKERTLIYGRDEFIVALAAGTVIPMGVLLFLRVAVPTALQTTPLLFVGSILPGLAAFNLQQTKPEYRRQDVRYTGALAGALLVLGVVFVSPTTARLIGGLTPPVLFAPTADIAVLRNAVVEGEVVSAIDTRLTVVGLLGVGFAFAELVRRQFDIRIGIISLALLALFAVASRWLFVLFLGSVVVSYVALTSLHRRTLLYGRVLLSIACGVGTLAALGGTLALPVTRGFSALFVGVVAGVDAYSIHVTPRVERRQQFALAVGVFATMLVLVRLVVDPGPVGVLRVFGVGHAVGGLLIAALCIGLAYRWRVPKPSDEAVRSASILSGGDGG